jgi:hypothetical protein
MQKAAKLIAAAGMLTAICSISHAPVFAQQEGASVCNAPRDLSSLSGVWSEKNAIIAAKHGAHRHSTFTA